MSISAEFEKYRAAAIHPNAPTAQIEECRRSFFASATAAAFIAIEALDAGSEQVVFEIGGIAQECAEFARSVANESR